MATIELQESVTSNFVQRHIRRDWRGDIEVLGVTQQRKLTWVGRKKTLVQIGCRSLIACEQAQIGLAGYVDNDASDWDTRRLAEAGDREHPFKLWLIVSSLPTSDYEAEA